MKEEQINVRMTELESNLLERMCEMEARNRSEMMRELLREGARRRNIWPAPAPDEAPVQAA